MVFAECLAERRPKNINMHVVFWEPSFTQQSTTIVISGSGSTSHCNQLCGKDAQKMHKANNDDACRV